MSFLSCVWSVMECPFKMENSLSPARSPRRWVMTVSYEGYCFARALPGRSSTGQAETISQSRASGWKWGVRQGAIDYVIDKSKNWYRGYCMGTVNDYFLSVVRRFAIHSNPYTDDPEHTNPLKTTIDRSLCQGRFSDLQLWRHHSWLVASREREVLFWWRRIRRLFFHAQIWVSE